MRLLILAFYLTNILPSLIRYRHFQKPVILMSIRKLRRTRCYFDSIAMFLPLFSRNWTTVTLCTEVSNKWPLTDS